MNFFWQKWWKPTSIKIELPPVINSVIKKGERGELVKYMQTNLKLLGYQILADGIFGSGTEQIVKHFQKHNGLVADGIVGAKTILLIAKRIAEGWKIPIPETPTPTKESLTENDYTNFAAKYGVEVAATKAVREVEASKGGYFTNGNIKILFEGHVFWKRLKSQGVNPNNHIKGNENILHGSWTKKYYGQNQDARMEKAKRINQVAAMESASYGLFQVMGYHWKSLGFDSVFQFVEYLEFNEANQLDVFGRFLVKNNLLKHLKAKDWAKFAYGYNGSGYKANNYDTKMAAAYRRYS